MKDVYCSKCDNLFESGDGTYRCFVAAEDTTRSWLRRCAIAFVKEFDRCSRNKDNDCPYFEAKASDACSD